MKNDLALFEGHKIRRLYDEETEAWWFSVVDVMQVLTQQPDYKAAQNYWKVLKHRLNKEGSQSVTKCNQLKLEAADGKNYLAAVATAETLLRLVQSVPSPKAEPIKLWLAKVGYERMQEMADPARALERARATWQKHRPCRTFHPPDCRDHRRHWHGRKPDCGEDRRQDCQTRPFGTRSQDRQESGNRRELPAAGQCQKNPLGKG